MKVINGNFHQGQIMSNMAGFQCTAIALYALLTVFTANPRLDIFTPDAINYIVANGHCMYEELLSQSNDQTPRYLGHWELPMFLQHNNDNIEVHRYENMLHGIVGMNANYPYTTTSIEEALPMAFSISNYFICTFGANTIAIFCVEGSEEWFIFDSHSRNNTGITSPYGSASFLVFSSCDECVQFIIQNYRRMHFEITPVIFERHNYMFINSIHHAGHTESTGVGMELNNTAEYKKNITKNQSVPETDQDKQLDKTKHFHLNSVNRLHVGHNESMDVYMELNNVNNSTKCQETILKNHSEPEKDLEKQIDNTKHFYININDLKCDDKKYEQQIRITAKSFCQCCEKLLFDDQIKTMSRSFKMNLSNGKTINESSTLCSKCSSQLSQNKQPNKYIDNNLDAGIVPECLRSLDIIQRRLISQIQSFMTIIILPGGQYAEKGLTIHFPLDMESYFHSLQKFQKQNILIVTHNRACRQPQVENIPVEKVVNFDDVRSAISWLKENNILYFNFPDLHTNVLNSDHREDQEKYEDIENDIMNTIHSGMESATVLIEYSVPDVDIDSFLSPVEKWEIPVQFDKPTWLSQMPHGEELAFPWLFPYGNGGIYESRSIKLSVLEYFQHRLYNKDDRWRKNITYLMYAVNHMEQTKLTNHIDIYMRLKKSDGKLTAGSLSQNSQSSDIKQNCFMFTKQIRGTVAYWADILQNLLATVKSLGPPPHYF